MSKAMKRKKEIWGLRYNTETVNLTQKKRLQVIESTTNTFIRIKIRTKPPKTTLNEKPLMFTLRKFQT